MSGRSTRPGVSRRWRVVDADGVEKGRWIERLPQDNEEWALECAASYYPGLRVQVQTITVSEWADHGPLPDAGEGGGEGE